ncbi:putative nucleotidyltransferase with HDIG domain [Sinomonas atrocyanea]|uniref:HD domain-containing protein n=1 Tax=Sinomonas atrocyanea TaxID=37927 RepID=UPI002789C56B|nr:HD domain-containing protein [Sinomonas atrocyanea]MDP9884627.1 putative nucleotidyltransferase with HDIG domain [Sinomonas atrocyanea]
MSALYAIRAGDPGQRREVTAAMPRLAELAPGLREKAVTAWVSAWLSSTHSTLEQMPYSLQAPDYRLLDHTNEVADAGILLADYAYARWSVALDQDILLAALLLHDIDKALLYTRVGTDVAPDPSRAGLPHGVLGAMLLKEAGLPDQVVALVGTHTTTSPVRNDGPEAWVLHYADLFACDHAFRLATGTVPFFQRV